MAQKYIVRVQYGYTHQKQGVEFVTQVTASDEADAVKMAKAECVGSRWPSRVYHAALVQTGEKG